MVQKSPRSKAADPVPTTAGGLNGFFSITKRGSTIAKEIRGGLVTFFTMAYIIALNPIIIGTTPDINGNLISGLPIADGANIPLTMAMVAAATALVAGVLTILMGLIGRFPVALAAGLGINALAAYTLTQTLTWPQIMGLIVWEGIIITILVLTNFRKAVFNAVPHALRTAISVGIGLFIALIGLVDAGFVRQGSQMGDLGIAGSILGWPLLVFSVALIALIILHVKKVKGAMLITIIGATILAIIVEAFVHAGDSVANPTTGWRLNVPELLDSSWLPDFSLLDFTKHVDMFGAFSAGGPKTWLVLILTILALMLADFFDTMGTVVAIGQTGKLLQADGNPPRTQEILLVDSIGAIAGGLFSTSSNTSYIESASGVSEGARTGFANIITGLAFIAAVFLTPLVKMVPSEAVAPALVLVGFFMMQQVTEIDWTDVEMALPAFFMVTMMAFTYSITVGIGLGFLVYLIVKTVRGKAKQVSPLLWVIGILFLIYFTQGVILELVG